MADTDNVFYYEADMAYRHKSPPRATKDAEDALKVLGRVADAFDNPGSLHGMDKEVLFVVNVVKSRHLLASLSSEESVCRDDSSFDTSYDEDVEVVELGDVSRWEHASSYPYASRRHSSPRSFSERIFRQEDGMYDVTKMLLTSSPLDRLDRLARMELKKTGWFERTDKWSVVELGLHMPLPVTPPKTPSTRASLHVSRSPGQTLSTTKTPSSSGEKHRSRREYGHDTPERNKQQQEQGNAVKFSTPGSIRSPDSDLADYSTLSYADASGLSPRRTTTPVRTSRLSRTLLRSQTPPQQTRGRLGQVVRNFVKRMLPPPSGSGRNTGARYAWHAKGDSPSEMTPRSDSSVESRWTFASAGSWMEASGQGCLSDSTNRWSGFWH